MLLIPVAWYINEGVNDFRMTSICAGINGLFSQKTESIHNSFRNVECYMFYHLQTPYILA